MTCEVEFPILSLRLNFLSFGRERSATNTHAKGNTKLPPSITASQATAPGPAKLRNAARPGSRRPNQSERRISKKTRNLSKKSSDYSALPFLKGEKFRSPSLAKRGQGQHCSLRTITHPLPDGEGTFYSLPFKGRVRVGMGQTLKVNSVGVRRDFQVKNSQILTKEE